MSCVEKVVTNRRQNWSQIENERQTEQKERTCEISQTRSTTGFKDGGRYWIRTKNLLLVRNLSKYCL